MATTKKKEEEPKMVIRPIGRLGGLDNIHVAMLVVIGILIVLLAVISFSKTQVVLQNQTTNTTMGINVTKNTTCSGVFYNGKCIVPLYNSSQVEMQVKKILASYNYVNGSLSLLPYFAGVNNMSLAYLPATNEWLARLQVDIPNSSVFSISFLFNGSNISDYTPYIQMARPSGVLDSYVASDGIIQLYNKYQCSSAYPLHVYWLIDPYAPGALASIGNLENLKAQYGNKINESIDIVYSSFTQRMASLYGNGAYDLGRALFCAYNQSNFTKFISGLGTYSSSFIPNSTIYSVAHASSLNMTQFDNCMSSTNTTQKISAQEILAKYYNVTTTPIAITDCEYMTLPQTVNKAICFANSTIC